MPAQFGVCLLYTSRPESLTLVFQSSIFVGLGLKEVLEQQPATQDKEQKKALREKKKQVRELDVYKRQL